jgi:hypothetical protein
MLLLFRKLVRLFTLRAASARVRPCASTRRLRSLCVASQLLPRPVFTQALLSPVLVPQEDKVSHCPVILVVGKLWKLFQSLSKGKNGTSRCWPTFIAHLFFQLLHFRLILLRERLLPIKMCVCQLVHRVLHTDS